MTVNKTQNTNSSGQVVFQDLAEGTYTVNISETTTGELKILAKTVEVKVDPKQEQEPIEVIVDTEPIEETPEPVEPEHPYLNKPRSEFKFESSYAFEEIRQKLDEINMDPEMALMDLDSEEITVTDQEGNIYLHADRYGDANVINLAAVTEDNIFMLDAHVVKFDSVIGEQYEEILPLLIALFPNDRYYPSVVTTEEFEPPIEEIPNSVIPIGEKVTVNEGTTKKIITTTHFIGDGKTYESVFELGGIAKEVYVGAEPDVWEETDFETVDLPDGTVEIIDVNKSKKNGLVIPETINGKTVTRIRQFTFDKIVGNLIIPDTVKFIGDRAFMYCDFCGEVVIGKDVVLEDYRGKIMTFNFNYRLRVLQEQADGSTKEIYKGTSYDKFVEQLNSLK